MYILNTFLLTTFDYQFLKAGENGSLAALAQALPFYNHPNKNFMTTGFLKSVFSVTIIFISSFCFSVSAQNTVLKSRVAVVAGETKTSIWVSDFPKKTSIVIMDTEDNLLSIVSTNEFGAVYLSLPTSLKTGVIVKTLDGEIMVSNKVAIKKTPEENVVVNTNGDENKA